MCRRLHTVFFVLGATPLVAVTNCDVASQSSASVSDSGTGGPPGERCVNADCYRSGLCSPAGSGGSNGPQTSCMCDLGTSGECDLGTDFCQCVGGLWSCVPMTRMPCIGTLPASYCSSGQYFAGACPAGYSQLAFAPHCCLAPPLKFALCGDYEGGILNPEAGLSPNCPNGYTPAGLRGGHICCLPLMAPSNGSVDASGAMDGGDAGDVGDAPQSLDSAADVGSG